MKIVQASYYPTIGLNKKSDRKQIAEIKGLRPTVGLAQCRHYPADNFVQI
jgi:hypothetical protein